MKNLLLSLTSLCAVTSTQLYCMEKVETTATHAASSALIVPVQNSVRADKNETVKRSLTMLLKLAAEKQKSAGGDLESGFAKHLAENPNDILNELVGMMPGIVRDYPDFANLLKQDELIKNGSISFLKYAIRSGLQKTFHTEKTPIQTHAITKNATRAELQGDYLLIIEEAGVILYNLSTSKSKIFAHAEDATFIDDQNIALIYDQCLKIAKIESALRANTEWNVLTDGSNKPFFNRVRQLSPHLFITFGAEGLGIHTINYNNHHFYKAQDSLVSATIPTLFATSKRFMVIPDKDGDLRYYGLGEVTNEGQGITRANLRNYGNLLSVNGFSGAKGSKITTLKCVNDAVLAAGYDHAAVHTVQFDRSDRHYLKRENSNAIPTAICGIKENYLAVGYNDGFVCIWDLRTSKVVKTIPTVDSTKGHPIELLFNKGTLRIVYSTGKIDDCYLEEFASFGDCMHKFAQL